MDEQAGIAAARAADTCPQCTREFDADRIGSGALADGIFCSLACMAPFHEDYYRERRAWGQPSEN